MTLSSTEIAAVILFVVFGGALLGIAIGRRLPQHHLSSETRTAVSVSMAVVGTMTALVISLLISSASTSLNARNADVKTLAMDIVRLDALLRRVGPEADPARAAIKQYASLKISDLFPEAADDTSKVDDPETRVLLERIQDLVLALPSDNDRHGWLKAQALQLTAEIGATRAQIVEQSLSSLPLPFIGAVALWFIILFASFGLFAPRNITVIIAMFLCAVAVASAFKLILDMDTPFEGRIRLTLPIRVSSEPLLHALHAIEQ